MIPKPKEEFPDPCSYVEQRRQPAANDDSYDGKTENNWTMLFASLCAFVAASIVLGAALWQVGKAIYKFRAELLYAITSIPWNYWAGVAAALGVGLCVAGVRWLRERHLRHAAMRRYLETTVPGEIK